MKKISYVDLIVVKEEMKGAIENRNHIGFREDYHVLHYLIKRLKPRRFFEIGTNTGVGTKIIYNALNLSGVNGFEVFSLDLPPEGAHLSKQYPGENRIGNQCSVKYTQLFGDSMNYDFMKHGRMDGWFVDGEHDYEHVFAESNKIKPHNSRVVIYHDSDKKGVYDGIKEVFKSAKGYVMYRVVDTRIAFVVKEEYEKDLFGDNSL